MFANLDGIKGSGIRKGDVRKIPKISFIMYKVYYDYLS